MLLGYPLPLRTGNISWLTRECPISSRCRARSILGLSVADVLWENVEGGERKTPSRRRCANPRRVVVPRRDSASGIPRDDGSSAKDRLGCWWCTGSLFDQRRRRRKRRRWREHFGRMRGWVDRFGWVSYTLYVSICIYSALRDESIFPKRR